MEKMFSKLITYVTMIMLFVSAIYFAAAITVPLGAQTVTEGAESTANQSQYAPSSVNAYAGNISELTISGRTQSKHWQGYYGEVTGTIVLDDASNWTLYDWPNSEPKGEIYATVNATTPSWSTVTCFNYSGNYTGGNNHTDFWESYYNMTFNDVDGLDETFNMLTHPQFDVGEFTIASNTCPSTFTHMSDVFQTDKFSELLLQDANGGLIFTTLIENDDSGNNTDITGYNGVSHDFQMLVAEDGTSRVGGFVNQATTTYYFYIDLQ